MIAGLETVSGGDILIDGQDVTFAEPSERGIAMVFQSYALYPHMNVYDNIAFNLKLARFGKDEIDKRVQEAARILRLNELLTRSPAQLSGGQRQRVAIGRAIVRNPKVFLFDEPLSNLDAALRVQMRLEIERLHRELGTTMIYVTHDQVEAMTLADRIVALDSGKIQQVGPPLDLYARPSNLFVAGFIGSPKMNLLPATIVGAGSGRATVGIDRAAAESRFELAIDAPAGDAVTIGVRPETVEIVSAGQPAPPGATALPAQVEVGRAARQHHLRLSRRRHARGHHRAGDGPLGPRSRPGGPGRPARGPDPRVRPAGVAVAAPETNPRQKPDPKEEYP